MLFVLIPLHGHSSEMQDDTETNDLPTYVVLVESDSVLPEMDDSCMWEKAIPIYFKVNKAVINPESPTFVELKDVVSKLNSGYSCRLVIIRSSASPEGGYQNNVSLAHRRARALVDSLCHYIHIPDLSVEERYVHEDYEGLRRMMMESDVAYRSKVISIIERYRGKDAQIKKALMALDGGRVWQQLLRQFYPKLRASRLLIIVSPRSTEAKPHSSIVEMVVDTVPRFDTDMIHISPSELIAEWHVPDHYDKEWQPMFNVKTNILYDLALTVPQYGWSPLPNVTVEFLPERGHITAAVEYMSSGWRNDSKLKTWIVKDILLEGRYYLRGNAAFTGHYLSAYANTAKYDIQFSATKAWLSKNYGDTWGCGVGWGYVKRIGDSPWKWEVNAGVGWLHTRYDRYHPAEEWATEGKFYYNWHDSPELFVKLRNKFNYVGLTRLGISISYDLPWPRWKKGGGTCDR